MWGIVGEVTVLCRICQGETVVGLLEDATEYIHECDYCGQEFMLTLNATDL